MVKKMSVFEEISKCGRKNQKYQLFGKCFDCFSNNCEKIFNYFYEKITTNLVLNYIVSCKDDYIKFSRKNGFFSIYSTKFGNTIRFCLIRAGRCGF